MIADIYGLLASEAPGRPAMLAVDEFQAVTELGAHVLGLFKALADEHPGVTLVLAGSRAHLMDLLTASSGAPFLRPAEPISLGPVAPADMAEYLRRSAEAGARRRAGPRGGLDGPGQTGPE